jgi:hypothetical protein
MTWGATFFQIGLDLFARLLNKECIPVRFLKQYDSQKGYTMVPMVRPGDPSRPLVLGVDPLGRIPKVLY